MPLVPPVGSMLAYAGPIDTAWERANGWLVCDGRPLDRTASDGAGADYIDLFDAVGFAWGGDGANKFNIPDMQGRFLRGVDGHTGRDPDAASRSASNPGGHSGDQVGSIQPDQYGSHAHGINDPGHGHGISDPGHAHGVTGFDTDGDGGLRNGFPRGGRDNGTSPAATHISVSPSTANITVGNNGGAETRPRNVYVYWIIRYR